MGQPDGTAKPPSAAQIEQREWVGAICEVTGWTPALMAARAGKLVKAIKYAGGEVDELREHYGQVDVGAAWWWYRDDWRGQKGQRPTDNSIRETWAFWNKPIVVAPTSEPAGWAALAEVRRLRKQQEVDGVYRGGD